MAHFGFHSMLHSVVWHDTVWFPSKLVFCSWFGGGYCLGTRSICFNFVFRVEFQTSFFFVCVNNRQFVFYAQVRTCLFCWTIGNFHCKFVLCSIELVIDVLMFTKSNMVSFFGKKVLDVLTI
jgi:hypothetical protein